MSKSGNSNSTIVDIAAQSDDFDTLVAALQAAGLVGALSGAGPFTVFAPNDAAFEKLPAGTVDALLQDVARLGNILKYHVVSGRLDAATLARRTEVTTLLGQKLSIRPGPEGSLLVNGARVIAADIEADNGIIHVIDSVLLPT